MRERKALEEGKDGFIIRAVWTLRKIEKEEESFMEGKRKEKEEILTAPDTPLLTHLREGKVRHFWTHWTAPNLKWEKKRRVKGEEGNEDWP
jgi:hypothetical protein